MNYQVQVREGYHYRLEYDTLERFISYYHQIKSVLDLKPESVLEIGVGNKLVSNYLTSFGVVAKTCDFDASLNPDIVSDIRNIDTKDGSFDVVMACQILEHIPFDEFESGLKELARVSKKHVMISLPCRHTGFEFVLKMPFVRTLFKKTFLDIFFRIPVKFPGFEKSGQHYWEIDNKEYNLHKVKDKIKKYYKIKKEFSPVLNKYHIFFVLEKN